MQQNGISRHFRSAAICEIIEIDDGLGNALALASSNEDAHWQVASQLLKEEPLSGSMACGQHKLPSDKNAERRHKLPATLPHNILEKFQLVGCSLQVECRK